LQAADLPLDAAEALLIILQFGVNPDGFAAQAPTRKRSWPKR